MAATALRVTYRNFEAKTGFEPEKLKAQLVRDISWGTFLPELAAARLTAGEAAHKRWQTFEPELSNLDDGRSTDRRFRLDFGPESFDIESEGVDHLVGTIAGDVVLNPGISHIEVEDLELTSNHLAPAFPGPNLGIDALYDRLLAKSLGGVRRPIIAFTVKPRFGLTVDDYASLFRAVAKAGIDIVEDDERLIDPRSCRFEERVIRLAKVQEEYGTLYSANITGDTRRAIERLDYCADAGLRMVKVDVLVCGFEVLRQVALRIRDKHGSKIAVTVYPDAYGAYRKIGRSLILKLSRLCGADIIYAGSPQWARYEQHEGSLEETINPVFEQHRMLATSISNAAHVKATLASITNDQHPSRSELLTAYLRKRKGGHYRYAFFVGGGISGFPGDMEKAARVMMSCVAHAATQDLATYVPYNLETYEKALEQAGMRRLDVAKALE